MDDFNNNIKNFVINIISLSFFFYPTFSIGKVFSKGNILNLKCPGLTIKKITYLTFDKIDKSEFINIKIIDCKKIKMIDELDSFKLIITTGRKDGKSVSCLSDSKSYPCKFIVGEFKKNIVPSVALKRIFDYEEPKPEFLNETSSRLFINIYKIFEKDYKNISSTLIPLNTNFEY